MQFRRISIWVPVGILMLFAVVQIVATYEHLYFYYRWLDIPMHVVGGALITLVAFMYAVYRGWGDLLIDRPIQLFLFATSVALFVGIAWELFEFVTNVLVAKDPNDLIDTLGDITSDLVGGLLTSLAILIFGYNTEQ